MAEKKRNDLGDAIIKGACNSEAKDLGVELAEIGLDSLLDEGLLKEIPVLKTIIACHKSWETVRDQLFLKKVAAFLLACPKVSDAEREKFANEIGADPKQARKLSDTLVLLLEKTGRFGQAGDACQGLHCTRSGQVSFGMLSTPCRRD